MCVVIRRTCGSLLIRVAGLRARLAVAPSAALGRDDVDALLGAVCWTPCRREPSRARLELSEPARRPPCGSGSPLVAPRLAPGPGECADQSVRLGVRAPER